MEANISLADTRKEERLKVKCYKHGITYTTCKQNETSIEKRKRWTTMENEITREIDRSRYHKMTKIKRDSRQIKNVIRNKLTRAHETPEKKKSKKCTIL